MKTISLQQRLSLHMIVDMGSGCWNWKGQCDKDGYGIISIKHQNKKVHRVAYEFHRGPIPAGLTIDHLCRNRACCNPFHLEPVTVRVNTARGQGITAINSGKTHCPAGHEYSDDNTRIWRGRRVCRPCGIERSARRYDLQRKERWGRKRAVVQI